MGNDNPTVSEAELEVLKALWGGPPGTVREVSARLEGRGRAWAYTTVQTLLQRLESKGYAAAEKGGPAHVYRAAVTPEQMLGRGLRELADRFGDGTASPLAHALIKGGQFTPQEIRRFRELLDRLDPPDRPRRRPQ